MRKQSGSILGSYQNSDPLSWQRKIANATLAHPCHRGFLEMVKFQVGSVASVQTNVVRREGGCSGFVSPPTAIARIHV